MEKGWVVFAVLGFFLLLFCVYNFAQIEKLKQENSGLRVELEAAESRLGEAEGELEAQGARLSSTKEQLEYADSRLEKEMGEGFSGISAELNATKERVGAVEDEFEQFQEEYIELQGQYEEKAAEYESLFVEIGDFERELQEKMYWYTENADFGGETKGFLSAADNCIEDDALNMPCVAHALEKRRYSYRSEGGDHIKSLDEFEDDLGGDCEDWSIFVKAIINEMEAEYGVDELRLVDYNRPGYFEVYEDDGVVYYYPYADINMEIKELQVACFPVSGGYGHCALVSDDVIFEPQDGSYIGRAEWDGEDYLIKGGGFVEVLIDDEDIHVDTSEGWVSYASFVEKIEGILEGKEE